MKVHGFHPLGLGRLVPQRPLVEYTGRLDLPFPQRLLRYYIVAVDSSAVG